MNLDSELYTVHRPEAEFEFGLRGWLLLNLAGTRSAREKAWRDRMEAQLTVREAVGEKLVDAFTYHLLAA